MIRDLAYMFLQSRRDPGFSTLGKATYSVGLILLLVASRTIGNQLLYYIYPAIVLLVELLFLSRLRGHRVVLNGLKLVALFTVIGVALTMFFPLPGGTRLQPGEAVAGAVRVVAFFLAFTQLFQLITVEEWRGILARIGLRDQAMAFTLALSQLPLTILYFSEALTTVSLKHRGVRKGSILTPLIYHAALSTRSRLEALLQYPVKPVHAELTVVRPRDAYLYLVLVTLASLLMLDAVF